MSPVYNESTNSHTPERASNANDQKGFRHFGDGIAGPVLATRLQAWNPTTLAWQDIILDNSTGGMLTSGSVGSGTGTQYNEGDVDTTITGTAQMWEDGSDTLRAVSRGKPLPVSVWADTAQHVNGRVDELDNTADDIIAAAGVGVQIAVMTVAVVNAHASVGTKVEILDGATVKIQLYAGVNGGGFVIPPGAHPLFVGTANTAVRGRCATTGSDCDFFAAGYKVI